MPTTWARKNFLIMLTPAAMLALVAPFVAAQESQAQLRARSTRRPKPGSE
jgi:hypothetical protein